MDKEQDKEQEERAEAIRKQWDEVFQNPDQETAIREQFANMTPEEQIELATLAPEDYQKANAIFSALLEKDWQENERPRLEEWANTTDGQSVLEKFAKFINKYRENEQEEKPEILRIQRPAKFDYPIAMNRPSYAPEREYDCKTEYPVGGKIQIVFESEQEKISLGQLDWMVSLVIAVGRENGQKYFTAEQIARCILYGDQMANNGGRVGKDRKRTDLARVPQDMAKHVTDSIIKQSRISGKLCGGILPETHPLLDAWPIEQEAKDQSGHIIRETVWTVPPKPQNEDEKDEFEPLIYTLAKMQGALDRMPQEMADLRKLLKESQINEKAAIQRNRIYSVLNMAERKKEKKRIISKEEIREAVSDGDQKKSRLQIWRENKRADRQATEILNQYKKIKKLNFKETKDEYIASDIHGFTTKKNRGGGKAGKKDRKK